MKNSIGIILLAFALLTANLANAQTDDSIPKFGAFFLQSLGGVGSPPYPFDPDHGVYPIQQVSPGIYVVEDESSGGRFRAMDDSSPISPADDGGGDYPQFNPPDTPDYGTNTWIRFDGVSSGNMAGIISNTISDVPYELQYETNLQSTWESTGIFLYGSELANWTTWSFPINSSGNLFLRARSWQDDGSGLPIWWQEQYFGYVGVDPNASDPAGDGWSNYQKFEMGLDPNAFVTPPTPQGLAASYNISNNTATVTWLPSPGPVTGYTIERDVSSDSGGDTEDFNVSASANNFADDISSVEIDPDYDSLDVSYKIQAHYTGGNSTWSSSIPMQQNAASGSIVSDSTGAAYLAIFNLPQNAVTVRLIYYDFDASFGYGDFSFNTYVDISVSDFTNGLFAMPQSWLSLGEDAYGDEITPDYFQTLDDAGNASALNSVNDYASQFYDGRVQLKQNLIFQLREARADRPFQFNEPGGSASYFTENSPTNYVYSSLYNFIASENVGTPYYAAFDALQPFEINYFFRNFVFTTTNVDRNGRINTGIGDNRDNGDFDFSGTPTFQFEEPAGAWTNLPALLDSADTTWLCSIAVDYQDSALGDVGITTNDSGYVMADDERNIFGLPFLSAAMAYSAGGNLTTGLLDAGGSAPVYSSYFYPEVAQPEFQTVRYELYKPLIDFLPGQDGFSPSNDVPSLIAVGSGLPVTYYAINDAPITMASLGNEITLSGYAKLALQNGYSNVFCYLQQYFDGIYTEDANGDATTNTAGFVDAYGDVLPTVAGPAALVTKPDPDTGERGTNTIYIVGLAFDANHDGAMDLNYQTSQESPFVFWCNNNYDRFKWDADDSTNYQDDLGPVDIAKLPFYQQGPDSEYINDDFEPAIPCTRDLEDYTRLWIPGLSAILNALPPTNFTAELTLSGDAQIRIFQAIELDGGTNYLFDETTASNQVANSSLLYVGLLTSSTPIILNGLTNLGDHFIFCGAHTGSARIDFIVTDPLPPVYSWVNTSLVDATAYIQINDIKQMYERWTVGDSPSIAPKATATLVDDQTNSSMPFFEYAPSMDTNTPYILFVHGWNMESWEKDRFAETAFKRLYWQGYQGRFGEFRWPTDNGFTGSWGQLLANPAQKDNFDASEYQAWRSAQGLLNKLDDLNAEYPAHVYMLAHSMGNVAASEALRLAGSNEVVNTYVASQAAVTAHTYDDSLPDSLFPSSSPTTPNIYGDWFANNNGGGAGQIVSFYNTNDYALSIAHWGYDQQLKPDYSVLEGTLFWNYGYSGSAGDPSPWNNFYKQISDSGFTVNFDIVNVLTNRYEVMGYAAQAYTTALGATPRVNNIAQNFDLTTIWPPDPTGKNYAEHFWHSAEFEGDYPQQQNYWNTLLFSSQFGFNIAKP